MSLIENALNKAGQEIREPGSKEGRPVQQSLKNILRLPSRSKNNRTVWLKKAVVLLLAAVIITVITYSMLPKTTYRSSQNPEDTWHRKPVFVPPADSLESNHETPERNITSAVEKTGSIEDTLSSSDMDSAPPEKIIDRTLPQNESDSTMTTARTAVPLTRDVSVDNYQQERNREAEKLSFLLKKAYIYGEAGKHVLALRCYNDILSLHPENYDALLNRGIINQKLGYTEDAEKDLHQAFVIDPQDPDLLNSLGVLYLNNGLVEEGRRLLLSAGTTTSLINLARFYWGMESWNRVEQTLKDALKIDGECPYTAYYLGLYYRRHKETEQARAYLNRAVKLARRRGVTEIMYAAEATTRAGTVGKEPVVAHTP